VRRRIEPHAKQLGSARWLYFNLVQALTKDFNTSARSIRYGAAIVLGKGTLTANPHIIEIPI
jgi:hypothetical protein